MEELLLLQRALHRDHLPLDATSGLDQRALQLAEYLRRAKTPTDEGAAGALGVDRNGTHYRKIRQRLKMALINGLTLTARPPGGEPGGSGSQSATAWKYFYLSISPGLRDYPQLAEHYLREAIRMAEQSNLPQVTMLAARMLRRRAAEPAASPVDYERYTAVYRRAKARYLGMAGMQDQLWDVKRLRIDEPDPARVVAYVDDALARLPARQEADLQAPLRFIAAYLRAVKHNTEGKYAETVALAAELSAVEESSGPVTADAYAEFLVQAAIARLHLGDHAIVEKIVEEIGARTAANPANENQLRQLLIVNEFRAGRYAAARERLTAIAPTYLRDLPPRARERYEIYRGYLQLLEHLGAVGEASGSAPVAFRMTKFLNEFSEANKDKTNLNVHLLIIRLIDGLLQLSAARTLPSTEAVERYVYRYLNDGHSERGKLFLRALLHLVRDAPDAVRQGEELIARLRELPVNTYRFPNTEVVPYHVLWDRLVKR